MKRATSNALFLCLIFIFSGCGVFTLSHYALGGVSPSASCDRTKGNSTFFYAKSRPKIISKKAFTEETERYLIYDTRLIYENEKSVGIRYYKSKRPDVRKAIIVFPVYGKHEYPAEMFASYASWLNQEADFDVFYIRERPHDDPLDIDLLANAKTENDIIPIAMDSVKKFKAAVIEARRIIDWLADERGLAMPRIGVVGFSTSSIAAALAISIDERISAAAILFGGGNLHEMVAFGEESRIKTGRKRVLSRSGKTQKEYAEFLRQFFAEVEPLAYAPCADPSRVLFVDSEFDEFIPKTGRDGLWQALRTPERITFRHGHRMSFLSLTPAWLFYLDKRTLEFFREKL